jgi:dipeptidyl aminopeptidase/acylaminoacyl peptidase
MTRKLELSDLLRLEHIEGALGQSWAWSPDGRLLAFVVQRPKDTVKVSRSPRLQGMDRADVWLVDVTTNDSRNLTEGAQDGSGWWAPEWSPDGHHLAMLSTRDGGVHLWTWDRASGSLHQRSRQSLRLHFGGQPFAWIDDHRLVCSLLPEGVRPLQMTLENRAADRAMAAWPVAWEGREPTASVLRSGTTATLVECDATLAVMDIRESDGALTELALGLSRWPIAPDVILAPDRKHVAYLAPIAPYQPGIHDRLRFSSPYRHRLHMTSLDGSVQVSPQDLGDVIDGSLMWSPDSSEVACITFLADRPHQSAEANLHAVRLPSASVTSFRTDLLDMVPDEEDPQLRWTADGRVIVQAATTSAAPGIEAAPRRDWWVVAADAPPSTLTATLPEPPGDLLAGPERHYFIAISDGRFWRIPLDHPPEPVDSVPSVTDIAWPSPLWRLDATTRATAAHSQIVLGDRDGEDNTTYRLVTVEDGTSHVLDKPAPAAELRDAHPTHQQALFGMDDETGSRVWLTTLGRQANQASSDAPRKVRESNTFLEEIAVATCRQIEYRSLNGDPLKGWLVLPPDYDSETRYPTVAWVYPGTIFSDRKPWLLQMAGEPSLNLHLLAAAGYVVLLPSMSASAESLISDPMLDLPNGVLTAVDHVVDCEIADPDRLYLMGHSFGGYAVYGLITQTHRFNAAVAISGISNLISNYGGFDARSRYEDHIDTQFFQQAWTESGQAKMGSPPWADLGRYLRNSPLFTVDRIQTPLLIVHSDLDFVGLQQGEEFFGALYRLGKPAEFVRYWGESHVLESPANIRDCWRRVLAWFALHGPKGEASGST